MSDTPQDAKGIFLAALEIQDSGELAAFVARSCGSDQDLRQRVEELLRAYGDPNGPLEKLAAALASTKLTEPIHEQPGTVIGHYKLMEQIGEGGFGLVFVAEQQHPIRRKVALKIIKPGMDTRDVIARFEAERQALALMDHPNIARVLDAGTTESGRPYFVMELVRGIPITDYCDQSRLNPQERLALFVSVCHAVQHAHQKGIIHRDIKPSNVLVTSHDGQPVVKIIDFGVAKALHQKLTERTIYTRFAQMIGTPMYMSPEQAEMSGLDIDTRCDVYSLGVLMYELLTGTTPFDRKRFAQAAFDELRRILREEEPPKPSTQLSRSTDSLPTIAAQRRTDPAKLSRMFHGDLDWITMKALEKDRTRRYGSARELAEDIERWERGDPVIAKPPTLGYLLGKYVRRNRLRLTTAVVIAAAAIVGISLEVYRIDRDRREAINNARRADEARAVADVAKEEAQLREREAREQRERAEAALKDAEHQRHLADKERGKAEERLRETRQVVDQYFVLTSESRLADVPGSESLRQELLRAALGYYQKFPKAETDNAEVQAELAASYFRMAQIENATASGDWLVEAEKGLVILERLIAAKTPVAKFKSLDAGVTDTAGRGLNLDQAAGGIDNAQLRQRAWSLFERGSHAWEKLVALNPKSVGFRNDLATNYNVLSNLKLGEAQLLSRLPRPSLLQLALLVREGIKNQTKARDLLQALANEQPERAHFRAALANSECMIGSGYWALKSYIAAVPPLQRAESLCQSLTREFPNVPHYWTELGMVYSYLTDVYFNQGMTAPTIEALRNWMAVAERKKVAFPTVPQYRVDVDRVTDYGLFRLPDLLVKNNGGYRGVLAIVDQYAQLKARRLASRAENREQAGQENDVGGTDSSAKDSAFPPPTTHVDVRLLAALKTMYERAPHVERAAILDAFTDRAHDPNCAGRPTYCMAEFAMRWWGDDRAAAVSSLERYAREMAGDGQFQLLLARARTLAHQAASSDRTTAAEQLDRLFIAFKSPSNDDKSVRRIAAEIQRIDPTGKLASRQWARLLDHQDATVRRRAIQSLPNDPGQMKEFKTQVEESLSDSAAGVRQAACDALAGMGTVAKSASPRLRRLLEDPDPEVCLGAARALWRLDRDPSGVKPLVTAFRKHSSTNESDVDFQSKVIDLWRETGAGAADVLPTLRQALASAFKSAKSHHSFNKGGGYSWEPRSAALLSRIMGALPSIDRDDTLAASGYPAIESPTPDWRVRVVDSQGNPVIHAMVHVVVDDRSGSPFLPDGINSEPPRDVITDGSGYLSLGYSIGKGDSKSRFLRELAMWTGLQATVTIDHPNHPRKSETIDVLSRNKPIELSDANTIRVRAHRGAASTVLNHLFPVFDGSVDFDSSWKEENDSLTIGRLDVKEGDGVQLLRVVHVPPQGPVLFSELIRLKDFKTTSVSLDLKLSPAVRLEGRLADQVPRPVKNGRVIVKIQKMGGASAPWEWGATAAIDGDGRFAIDSLPPDANLQLITACDGWVSKSPDPDEQKKYAAEYGRNGLPAQTPTRTYVDPRLCRLQAPMTSVTVPMERTGKCLLTVVDKTGKPVPKASIELVPNYRWQYTYFETDGWAEINSLAQIQARMSAKVHKVAPAASVAARMSTDEKGRLLINGVPIGGKLGPGSDSFLTVSDAEGRSVALSRDDVAGAGGEIKNITVRLPRP